MSLNLTYDQAKADLLRIAEQAPERTIRDMGGLCLYFIPPNGEWEAGDLKPGEGCCIVGRVLETHGLTYKDLQVGSDIDRLDMNQGCTVKDLAEEGILTLDNAALTLLLTAQAQQDGGQPWSEAVRVAIEAAESEPPC